MFMRIVQTGEPVCTTMGVAVAASVLGTMRPIFGWDAKEVWMYSLYTGEVMVLGKSALDGPAVAIGPYRGGMRGPTGYYGDVCHA